MLTTLCDKRKFSSGLICLFTGDDAAYPLGTSIAEEVARKEHGFAIIYFSKEMCSAQDVCHLMQSTAPALPFAACSTAGEITPLGLDEGQLIILLFPKMHFAIEALTIATQSSGMDEVVAEVRHFKNNFMRAKTSGSVIALCLLDGASFLEETATAAMHWGLDEVPLLGGSAGDNLHFAETSLVLNGEVVHQGGILLLVHTDLPMEIFKTENFVPSQMKLVVTRSDPDRRIVHEFNAEPAAVAYADVIGADPHNLTPQSFASHPLVMRVGGEYYCRSIQKVNADGSLSFFCAVDDGIVLTVAEQTGMARTTNQALDDVETRMGGLDFVLGFDCVLRRIDARNRQVTQKVSRIYRDYNVLGFNTYGEQYRSLHLNQTLTGVAFGHADVVADKAI